MDSRVDFAVYSCATVGMRWRDRSRASRCAWSGASLLTQLPNDRVALGSARLQRMADLYNLLNSDATIRPGLAVGPRLGAPSEVVQDRLLRQAVAPPSGAD